MGDKTSTPEHRRQCRRLWGEAYPREVLEDAQQLLVVKAAVKWLGETPEAALAPSLHA